MGDLRLDSRAGIRNGGSRGPAIVPGEPQASLLIKALSYRDLHLKMPPTGKLSDETVADFVAWIKAGAPDPRTLEREKPASSEKKDIDLSEARKFWSFQPVRDVPPPQVKNHAWPLSPIDHFILAALEEEGLEPAPTADKRTLIRRVSFDLIGLPPTRREVDAFLADESPQAFKHVVERLLDSPHYGERWARHWLDLVRFAETNGHEYDNDKPDPWRYRDYVIEALNNDLPYDQFVKEHIAGDLLPQKRLVNDGTRLASPLATGFFWLGEVLNSATDSEKSRADQIDNQLDVMGKTFLGLTVACARCHDHKFDPIPTRDYYSLAGILQSTDLSEVCVDSPQRAREIAAIDTEIADLNRQIEARLEAALASQVSRLKEDLLAAAEEIALIDGEVERKETDSNPAEERQPGATPWVRSLNQALKDPGHPFHPFAVLARGVATRGRASFTDSLFHVRQQLDDSRRDKSRDHPDRNRERGDVVFADFDELSYQGWAPEGRAFGKGPSRRLAPQQAIAGYQGQGLANSFGSSDRLVGTLTSAKFRMPQKRYVHVLLAGTEDDKKLGEDAKLRLTLVADDFKSAHLVPDGSGQLKWQTIHTSKERDRMCYFEVVDHSRQGHIAIDKIIFSDSQDPPPLTMAPYPLVLALVNRAGPQSLEALAEAYQQLFQKTIQHGSAPAGRSLLGSIVPTGRLEDMATLLSAEQQSLVHELAQRRSALEDRLPVSAFAMTSADYEPHDIKVHVRGNHKNLGEEVPRRFLQIIAGENQTPFIRGSGRLELAEWLASPENPLTARVMVNRVWKHHFGNGIVGTTDNFGQTGERPTHPALLDFLAKRFIANGWSLKALHRMMLLSRAYQMSSRPSKKAAELDPQNRWLSHMPVQRLEAEAIRDSILVVAGTLDRTIYGPSVPPHISEYQDGSGKPESGPLDGAGRRSLYLQVRRNFLTPLFLAFDYPPPISSIGRRGVSTVPSQALILLNNEFVGQQAHKWAEALLAGEGTNEERLEQMFVAAFARPPLEKERRRVESFLAKQRNAYDEDGENDVHLWADLAHVLINSPEFIFIR